MDMDVVVEQGNGGLMAGEEDVSDSGSTIVIHSEPDNPDAPVDNEEHGEKKPRKKKTSRKNKDRKTGERASKSEVCN